jgi:N-acyl homoserine lactone hydrolase
LLAAGGAAPEAGEVQDEQDEAHDPDGDADPRDDEEEDDPDDEQGDADSDHGCDVPGMNGDKPVIRAHLAAHVEAYGGLHPVYVHTVEHPDGLVLVDTGLPDPPPLPEELRSRVAVVVNTHLHVDHCGGNRCFPGVPVHVQARELAAAGAAPDEHTRPEWVHAPGVVYVEHDGEAELLPGIRLVPTPGHTAGHQSVLVEDVGLIGGDVAYSFRSLGDADTEGKRRVLALGVETWLAHVERSHVPRRN